MASSSSHPLLESVGSRFQQNRAQQQDQVNTFIEKRSAEKVHSQFIQQNTDTPHNLGRAQFVANHFAKKHGIKDASNLNSQGQGNATSGTPSSTASSRNAKGTGAMPKTNVPSLRTSVEQQLGTSTGSQTSTPGTSTAQVENRGQKRKRTVSSSSGIITLDSSIDESFTISNEDGEVACPVLNCEAKFSSETSLGHHMNLFQHSPCNPFLKLKDCKQMVAEPLLHMCPECNATFKTEYGCREHMKAKGHLMFMDPLEVTAFMCPQCLYLFENREVCQMHITKSKHHTCAYPFSKELYNTNLTMAPCPVSQPLVTELVRLSKNVPFTISCLECSMVFQNPAELRHHLRETQNIHVASVFTDSSIIEIFSQFLASYSCQKCHVLFNEDSSSNFVHMCSSSEKGTIIENDTASFSEFVKRCAVTVLNTRKKKVNDGSSVNSTTLSQNGSKAASTKHKASIPKETFDIMISDSDDDNVLDLVHGAAALDYRTDADFIDLEALSYSTCVEDINQLPVEIESGAGGYNSSKKNGETTAANSGNVVQPEKVKAAKAQQECELTKVDLTKKGKDHLGSSKAGNLAVKSEAASNIPGPSEITKQPKVEVDAIVRRDRSRSPIDGPVNLISTAHLSQMTHIIFLDLDNWPCFFSKLPRILPNGTFVWGFKGGGNVWREPRFCNIFNMMKLNKMFYLHGQCGLTKDAADFAIVLTVGTMHERLPKHIPFTILSGDKGFLEVERQMRNEERKASVLDPHSAAKFSNEMIYMLICSITDN
ncbi:E3 SUMO-protein ligase ZNF451-like [Mya arenaria]|uniref:E3 SUMO-protein ligase ZNF451-like n=1 Tax=Mya arenaria TaxID=6604 RepID=UPI0022E3D124|nr:E3 SUMO-protein ligase ZNF451-like [Mya arenaria]